MDKNQQALSGTAQCAASSQASGQGASAAVAATGHKTGGPFMAIRNFFRGLFPSLSRRQTHSEHHKTNATDTTNTGTSQKTDTTKTTATSNTPSS